MGAACLRAAPVAPACTARSPQQGARPCWPGHPEDAAARHAPAGPPLTPRSHPASRSPLQPAGDRAWETVFGAFAPVLQGEPLVDATLHSVVLQIPLEGEAAGLPACLGGPVPAPLLLPCSALCAALLQAGLELEPALWAGERPRCRAWACMLLLARAAS